ncbi:LuxR C-terminal-related transcriptional regulator [Burkholderia glumae]|uniref:LuxR C-terminal-related transcriptional regulator n=1 Tax=Burkholderia glumae TaxID=337 RepID=A0AAQ0BQD6_BURGL|nr:LuxR C-terminal-related transcriptional regulator [Burkholderia glumae]ACR31082.1 LuxR family transcriptional regulator [Burkholderia glumae BGR1]KHJ64786.1 LuxR family transcriptional regulator [Burkholderia glumae]MCM2483595.1 LuxR C-terminal-related transcriptional regulator [Burkholderia glumae]MCM2509289.1 LuxR C-terminal-related transcriptional regulator [Burkholderia glumae]MCM2541376.1 LuxR C-terminal-related transcriptional regulator [Burkholderia glumae]
MTYLDNDLSSLVGQLYDASLDSRQWAGMASTIAAAFNGNSAVLKLHDGANVQLLETTDNLQVPPARLDWATHWHQNDLWVHRAVARSVETIFTDRDLVTPREQRESGFYREWLRELDIYHVVGTLFPVGNGTLGVLGVHRPKAARHFSTRDRHRAAFLLPHLRRAFQLSQRLSSLQHDVALEVLNRVDTGVLVTNQSCQVLYANAMAEYLLGSGQAIRSHAGRVRLNHGALHERLVQLIQASMSTASGRAKALGPMLRVPRAGRLPLTLSVSPLKPSGLIKTATPLALVMLRDPEYPTASVRYLQELFGFTPTESAIAADLAMGLSLEEIARRKGIGMGTVRSRLKRVLAKTGTNRQAEVAVLVARSVALFRPAENTFSPK